MPSRQSSRPTNSTSRSSHRSVTSSLAARSSRITPTEIEEMWSRARGTFQYPDYDAQGKQVKRPQTQDTLDAVALRQHESKTDREARRRKEKVREFGNTCTPTISNKPFRARFVRAPRCENSQIRTRRTRRIKKKTTNEPNKKMHPSGTLSLQSGSKRNRRTKAGKRTKSFNFLHCA